MNPTVGLRGWLRIAAWIVVSTVVTALLLFVSAGRWNWRAGWEFLGLLLGLSTIVGVVVFRMNPEILDARAKMHRGSKVWDQVLVAVLLSLMALVLVVAGFDAGRFHPSQAPRWYLATGYILLVLGTAVSGWAEAVNKFFEPTVRIQTDRGHRVVDSGPYAWIRHPGYIGGALVTLGMAMALGSYWALAPALSAVGLLILRTYWEEETLRAELTGYEEYTHRVRSRWIPGVW
jgi:protein-S-isoprenylcysteine O-methyltransferase Ste14